MYPSEVRSPLLAHYPLQTVGKGRAKAACMSTAPAPGAESLSWLLRREGSIFEGCKGAMSKDASGSVHLQIQLQWHLHGGVFYDLPSPYYNTHLGSAWPLFSLALLAPDSRHY